MKIYSKFYPAVVCVGFSFVLSCGAPQMDVDTSAGKGAILDAVNLALTDGDCTEAIRLIEGLYASQYTDNEVRMLRAASHACAAGVNFFSLVGDLAESTSDLSGAGFWTTMAQTFPSSFSDTRAESAWFATDALMATLNDGVVIPDSRKVNSGTNNEGSTYRGDRTDDSNAYMIFTAMAAIGTLQNRYGFTTPGVPSSDYKKQTALPWVTPGEVDQNGCGFAGSVLNMVDAIESVENSISSGTLKDSLSSMSSFLKQGMALACEMGCRSQNGFNTGCTLSDNDCNPLCPIDFAQLIADPTSVDLSDCIPCPLELRNRNGCSTGDADTENKPACSAAGITIFVNDDPIGGGTTNWQCVDAGCT